MRYALALEVASIFEVHLRAELAKRSELTSAITFEGVTFAEITADLLRELLSEFPELSDRDSARANVFERWWNSLKQAGPYSETTFKSYNNGFIARLLDFKHGTRRSRYKMTSVYREILKRGSTKPNTAFNFQSIYAGESRLTEYLRRALTLVFPESDNEVFDLLHDQQDYLNQLLYGYFDTSLKESLQKSEELLQNVLPVPIARELKETGSVKPRMIEAATIMFIDIAGFTKIAEELSPESLVQELNRLFKHMDANMARNGIDKIKTIGDCYMCAAGVLTPGPTHAVAAVMAALRTQQFMKKYASKLPPGQQPWHLRIGIHTGPVISGVLGLHRLNFDIWGDAVNIAQRMEAAGGPDRVNISSTTKELVSEFFETESRGKLPVKNKEELEMFFVNGIRPELSADGKGLVPGSKFVRKLAQLRKKY